MRSTFMLCAAVVLFAAGCGGWSSAKPEPAFPAGEYMISFAHAKTNRPSFGRPRPKVSGCTTTLRA